MQNKIIILIAIILNLTISNAQSNDQITFDVSELEILDNGKKVLLHPMVKNVPSLFNLLLDFALS